MKINEFVGLRDSSMCKCLQKGIWTERTLISILIQ